MIQLNDYPIFNENKASLKETSMDDSDPSAVSYMTESSLEVINFDQVKRRYTNALGLSENNAASVDAVIPFSQHIAFVEFKNGKVNNRNVKDKLRDSLLLFLDITGKTAAYARNHLDFILVYNLEKNPLPNQYTKGILQESPSRIAIAEHFSRKADTE